MHVTMDVYVTVETWKEWCNDYGGQRLPGQEELHVAKEGVFACGGI